MNGGHSVSLLISTNYPDAPLGFVDPVDETRKRDLKQHLLTEASVAGALGQNEIQLDGQCWDTTIKTAGTPHLLAPSVTDTGC